MKFAVMFHHFHDDKRHLNSPGGGSISADEFHLIIDYIDRNFDLLTPDEYIHKIERDNLRESDVCLTFDDALQSQFDIVYPELEIRGVKAFFFVYSAAFSSDPPSLEFFRDFRLHFFKNVDEYYGLFFDTVRLLYSEQYSIFLERYQSSYLSACPFYTENDRKYRFLRDVILKDDYFELVRILMKEKGYCQLDRKNSLFMRIDDLKILHGNGHTIGLHSDTHPTRMDNLSDARQVEEYTKNFEFLNSVIGERIKAMSHPCGNYNDVTLDTLKRLGVTCGFRSSLTPSYIKSSLEIPREDHANLIKNIRL